MFVKRKSTAGKRSGIVEIPWGGWARRLDRREFKTRDAPRGGSEVTKDPNLQGEKKTEQGVDSAGSSRRRRDSEKVAGSVEASLQERREVRDVE